MPRGKKASKGLGKSWNLYLPAELNWIRDEMEAEAEKQRRSVSEVVLLVLESYLKVRPKTPAKGSRPEMPGWLTEKVPD